MRVACSTPVGTTRRALRSLAPNRPIIWLLLSGSTLYYCSVEEQEREAGLTRNDYFSLWQVQGYAKFRDDATRRYRRRV
jgi:hypothetical protein